MNALIVKGTADGVELELQLSDDDPKAKFFAQWIHEWLHKMEEAMPEVEVTQ